MSEPLLSWRVPTVGDPRLLRVALAQVGLASVVAALILLVAVPREWLVPALVGLIPLAVFMAFWRWSAYRRSMAGDDNVWIDDDGVHWLDTTDEENSFRRIDITGFHIGRHVDTLRPVPALTLHLAGGFESQPIELHPPATTDAIRDVLGESWQIAEHDEVEAARAGDYDTAVSIYGECHDEFQEWHWEGTKEELAHFFSLFAIAADELPLPPAGAKPAACVISLTRRQPARLRIAHAPIAHIESGTIIAPGLILRDIAAKAQRELATAASATDERKFDVALGPKNVWTFHVHVKPT
jgi:hypothetical protein